MQFCLCFLIHQITSVQIFTINLPYHIIIVNWLTCAAIFCCWFLYDFNNCSICSLCQVYEKAVFILLSRLRVMPTWCWHTTPLAALPQSPLPSRPATIYKPRYFTLAPLHFFQPFVPFPPLPLALTTPLFVSLPLLSSSFPFLPWGRWRRRLSGLFARISRFSQRRSLLFISHFLRRITATARRCELEWMQQSNLGLIWSMDSVVLANVI